MKRIVHDNINPPYSLHDMSITAFEVTDNKITMRSDTGMVNTTPSTNHRPVGELWYPSRAVHLCLPTL